VGDRQDSALEYLNRIEDLITQARYKILSVPDSGLTSTHEANQRDRGAHRASAVMLPKENSRPFPGGVPTTSGASALVVHSEVAASRKGEGNNTKKKERRRERVANRTPKSEVHYKISAADLKDAAQSRQLDAELDEIIQYPLRTGIDTGTVETTPVGEKDDPKYEEFIHAMLAIKYVEEPQNYRQAVVPEYPANGARLWTASTIHSWRTRHGHWFHCQKGGKH
jgi:hypothetical protein